MPRTSLLLIGLACSLVGCAHRPPMPSLRVLLQEGKLSAALYVAATAIPPPPAADVAQAIAAARARLRPSLHLAVVPPAALVARLGEQAARALGPRFVVLEATLRAETADGPTMAELELWLGDEGRKLGVHRTDVASLTALTGEQYPPGRRSVTWKMDDNKVWPRTPQTLGEAVVAAPLYLLVKAPLDLLSLHRARHETPPSDEEVRAKAPRAWALARALAPRCEPEEGCTRWLLVERPAQNEQPLVLHAALSFAFQPRGTLSLVEDQPLPAGVELEQSLPRDLRFDASTVRASVFLPEIARCRADAYGRPFEHRALEDPGPCGLLPPRVPR